MKVADAIKQMSKLPLQRIVDSFTKDFPKPDEDQACDIILRNAEELTNPDRIAAVVVVPVFWTRGRPKHQAALRLSFSRTRAGVRYPCRWRSHPRL